MFVSCDSLQAEYWFWFSRSKSKDKNQVVVLYRIVECSFGGFAIKHSYGSNRGEMRILMPDFGYLEALSGARLDLVQKP